MNENDVNENDIISNDEIAAKGDRSKMALFIAVFIVLCIVTAFLGYIYIAKF